MYPCRNTLAELEHDRSVKWLDSHDIELMRQKVINDLAWDSELMCQAFEHSGYYVEPALINELCHLLQFTPSNKTPEQRAIINFQTALIDQLNIWINRKVEGEL